MTKHRSVVTGWDPDYVNPDTSTGRPKGVQTAIDMRIATTHDVLAEGVFAAHGTPAITGSPTDSASISPFMAAIESPLGGFYIVQLDDDENFTINMSNVGAVKIYVQQQDYEVNAAQVDSEVVIGVVYGATAIPDGALLLFTTTITSETSTSGLTFTPAFSWTGAASGMIQVPTQADLANIVTSLITAGRRALVTTTGGGGTIGEYFYNGSAWQQTTVANPSLESFLLTGWLMAQETWEFVSADNPIGILRVNANVTSKYNSGMRIKFTNGGNVINGIILIVGSYSGGYTNITFLHEINPSNSLALNLFANSAITSNYYSPIHSPVGFPLNPDKWTVYKKYTNDFNDTPSGTTIYNAGGAIIALPIGLWKPKYKVLAQVGVSGSPTRAKYMTVSLSTANNTLVPDNNISLAGAAIELNRLYAEKSVPIINLTSKTNYYLNYRNDGGSGDQLFILGTQSTTVIEAVSAYL